MIALARGSQRNGARFAIAGELSANADWSQTLNFPADGNSISLTGLTVRITFRKCASDTSAEATFSTTDSHITISDADTLTISVDADELSDLCGSYAVDITTKSGGNAITHWASGTVFVSNSPVAW